MNVKCGFTSIIDKVIGIVQLFELSSVRKPALKLMIANEQATLKPGESSDPTGDNWTTKRVEAEAVFTQ